MTTAAIPKYLLLFICLCTSALYSQEYNIDGLVKDKVDQPIGSANVLLYDDQNFLISYTYADINGKFKFTVDQGTLPYAVISVTSLGYNKKSDTIYFNEKKRNYSIVFALEEKLEALNEVVIKPENKIRRKDNTYIYNVDAFRDNTEQTVEDLLKKLPGIEVLENGIIKAHGRNIDKLLVEGDDMFDKNYTILSKNLDAKVLSNVEILEGFEDNPVLAKVLSSNKVAINLKLKEEYKNIWFGNATAGIGTEERMQFASNIGLIRKDIKFFNFNNFNNLGNYANALINEGQSNNEISTYRNWRKLDLDPFYESPNSSVPFFSNTEATFNEAFINSLSFVKRINDDVKLRGTGFYLKDNEDFITSSQTVFNTSDPPIIYNENRLLNRKRPVFGTDIEVKYNLSENTYLKNTTEFRNGSNDTNQRLLFNNDLIDEDLNTDHVSFINHLNYTTLVNKKLIHNYAYFGFKNSDQSLRLISPSLNAIFDQPVDNVLSNQSDDKLIAYGIRSSMMVKIGKLENTLELGFDSSQERRQNTFLVDRFDNSTQVDSIQNNLKYSQRTFEIKTNSEYKISNRVELYGALSFNYADLSTDLSKNNRVFLNPKIGLRLKNLKIGTISIQYRRDFDSPQSSHLLDNFQISNYQSFLRGGSTIQFIERDKFRFAYNISNRLQTQSLSVNTQYTKNKGRYSSRNTINQDFSFSTAQFVDGGEMLISKVDFTSYFRKLDISTTIGTFQSLTNTPFLLNADSFSELNLYLSTYFVRGRTYFEIPLNFNFNLSLSQNQTDFNNVKSKTNWTSLLFNTTYTLSKELTASLNNKFYFLKNGDYKFINFEMNFNPKKSRFAYKLALNNIANEKFFILDNVDEFSSFNSSFRLLPRYLYIQARYRF